VCIYNGASLTATLPDPTLTISGTQNKVKNINASALTVVSAGTSKTIDGAASQSLAQWAKATYVTGRHPVVHRRLTHEHRLCPHRSDWLKGA